MSRILLGLFYRKIEAVGLEHVPATGPLLVVANHQNALVDAMLLIATLPRPLRPVAKAPLFGHPLLGPLLRLAGAIPVYRRHDPGTDPARNVEAFEAVATTFARGAAVLIFPEGVSQPEPTIMPLRTGAARMVLAAAARGVRVGVLPVGLVFHEPGRFRAGRALVVVGAPVPTEDAEAGATTDLEGAMRDLTRRLAAALGGLVVEAGDRETLRILVILEAIWREESGGRTAEAAARAEWMRRALRAYRHLAAREPGRVVHLRAEVERYAKDLELAGWHGAQLGRTYQPRAVWRYALREGTALGLGLPLALWGLLNHALPYWLTRAAVRALRPSPDAEATYKIVAGAVLYPLCWAAEGWTAWVAGGAALAGAFTVSLAPTGFFALTWRDRLVRFGRETRAFARFLVDRDLRARLLARRHGLRAELERLAAAVPEAILAADR